MNDRTTVATPAFHNNTEAIVRCVTRLSSSQAMYDAWLYRGRRWSLESKPSGTWECTSQSPYRLAKDCVHSVSICWRPSQSRFSYTSSVQHPSLFSTHAQQCTLSQAYVSIASVYNRYVSFFQASRVLLGSWAWWFTHRGRNRVVQRYTNSTASVSSYGTTLDWLRIRRVGCCRMCAVDVWSCYGGGRMLKGSGGVDSVGIHHPRLRTMADNA